jgi:hypothetical protein
MMRMLLASTIIWKAREYRKSPTSTLAGLPKVSLAVAPAPQDRFVHDVVMQQRGRVDEFDHRSQVETLVAW